MSWPTRLVVYLNLRLTSTNDSSIHCEREYFGSWFPFCSITRSQRRKHATPEPIEDEHGLLRSLGNYSQLMTRALACLLATAWAASRPEPPPQHPL